MCVGGVSVFGWMCVCVGGWVLVGVSVCVCACVCVCVCDRSQGSSVQRLVVSSLVH